MKKKHYLVVDLKCDEKKKLSHESEKLLMRLERDSIIQQFHALRVSRELQYPSISPSRSLARSPSNALPVKERVRAIVQELRAFFR